MLDNSAFSGEYNKALVKIIFSSNEYYTVYGLDPESESGDADVFLSAGNGKHILLFSDETSKNGLTVYLQMHHTIVMILILLSLY